MKTFVSFQYSDRSTSVLLIVSLAGIKVCSPDGKVSIINTYKHTHTHTHIHTRAHDFASKKTRRRRNETRVRGIQRERGERKADREEAFTFAWLNVYSDKITAQLRKVNDCEQLSTLFFQCVQMAHALRRISYATCEPQHAQFSFLAREPRAHFSIQYCHSFITESAEQVSVLHFTSASR
ncbi:SH2 domain-containing protein 5 [Melipona quadrifasciata]|uniref:SH2 domain-containing protein 5 n=1 Tax=Melipona quadrifasciata TaxID=166423 RepID=A0A0M9A3C1_9HYME|nr:SH2 domain-containing protein 5 [Melipona quadrifasciata]